MFRTTKRLIYVQAALVLAVATARAQAPAPTYGTDGIVLATVRSGSTVYLGGEFTAIGKNYPYGTALDSATGLVKTGFAKPNGYVYCAVPDGAGGWYIGGTFTQVGGVTRNRLAQINSAGQVTAWNPSVSNTVRTVVVTPTVIYAGGDFTSVNTDATPASRSYLAAFNTTTGAVTSWNPGVSNIVFSLAASGTTLYAGGLFNTVNTNATTKTRNYLAAFDMATATNNATTWDPSSNSSVYSVAISGTTLYAGGTFTSVNTNATAKSRSRLAAFDLTAATNNATTWDPSVNATVNSVAVSGTTVYAGGEFTAVNVNATSKSRGSLASFATGTATNNATTWDPNIVSGYVSSVAVSGNTVYAGGLFFNVNAGAAIKKRSNLAAFDATTATANATAWDPSLGTSVFTVGVSGGTVYAGGTFAVANAASRNRLGAVDATTGVPTSWDPSVNDVVRTLVLSGTTMYAGGDFTTVNTNATMKTRSNLAAFDIATATNNATTWDPSLDGSVYALALSGSTMYAGGYFNSVNTNATVKTRTNLAAFTVGTATNNATTWDPRPDDAVNALAVSGTTVYAGGSFYTVNGNATSKIRPSLAAFATGTATNNATTWNPDLDGPVSALLLNGNTLYAGGYFTYVNNNATAKPRTALAAFDVTTATNNATTWDASINSGGVSALALSGTTVYVGGNFSSVNSTTTPVSRTNLAAFDVATATATSWAPSIPNATITALAVSGSTVHVGGIYTSVNGVPTSNYTTLNSTGAIVLPLSLLDFSARAAGAGNEIAWQVGGEAPGTTYTVERSATGTGFEALGTRTGTGDGTYGFSDNTVHGTAYYRLRMVEQSGWEGYSPVVVVRRSDAAAAGSVILAPQPAASTLTVSVSDASLHGSPATVFDLQGREVARFALAPVVPLDVSRWPAGLYALRLPTGEVLRLVKQ